jgi:hypothetical protein
MWFENNNIPHVYPLLLYDSISMPLKAKAICQLGISLLDIIS